MSEPRRNITFPPKPGMVFERADCGEYEVVSVDEPRMTLVARLVNDDGSWASQSLERPWQDSFTWHSLGYVDPVTPAVPDGQVEAQVGGVSIRLKLREYIEGAIKDIEDGNHGIAHLALGNCLPCLDILSQELASLKSENARMSGEVVRLVTEGVSLTQENARLKQERDALKERVERYEKALREIRDYKPYPSVVGDPYHGKKIARAALEEDGG